MFVNSRRVLVANADAQFGSTAAASHLQHILAGSNRTHSDFHQLAVIESVDGSCHRGDIRIGIHVNHHVACARSRSTRASHLSHYHRCSLRNIGKRLRGSCRSRDTRNEVCRIAVRQISVGFIVIVSAIGMTSNRFIQLLTGHLIANIEALDKRSAGIVACTCH